jgi:hypothetical protein
MIWCAPSLRIYAWFRADIVQIYNERKSNKYDRRIELSLWTQWNKLKKMMSRGFWFHKTFVYMVGELYDDQIKLIKAFCNGHSIFSDVMKNPSFSNRLRRDWILLIRHSSTLNQIFNRTSPFHETDVNFYLCHYLGGHVYSICMNFKFKQFVKSWI